jgi:hypothetical protein
MFWTILLAHAIADYPLQPNWLVAAKKTWLGLTLHIIVHLITMLVLVGTARTVIWPYLVFLSIIHFMIDIGKNAFSKQKPDWIITGYLSDQAFHIMSIGLVVAVIKTQLDYIYPAMAPVVTIYILGYLLVSHIWFITERVFAYRDASYKQVLNQTSIMRILSRIILLSSLLLGLNWHFAWLIIFAATLSGVWYYLPDHYKQRIIINDSLIVFIGLIFIQVTLLLEYNLI